MRKSVQLYKLSMWKQGRKRALWCRDGWFADVKAALEWLKGAGKAYRNARLALYMVGTPGSEIGATRLVAQLTNRDRRKADGTWVSRRTIAVHRDFAWKLDMEKDMTLYLVETRDVAGGLVGRKERHFGDPELAVEWLTSLRPDRAGILNLHLYAKPQGEGAGPVMAVARMDTAGRVHVMPTHEPNEFEVSEPRVA